MKIKRGLKNEIIACIRVMYSYNKLEDAPTPREFELHRVKIENSLFTNDVTVTMYVGRPGIFIGKRGCHMEWFKSELSRMINKSVKVKIVELDPLNRI